MRLIDVDDALKWIEKMERTILADSDGEKRISIQALKRFLDNRQTIDGVPVVRCHDCKYWADCEEGETFSRCAATGRLTGKNGYCRSGKRKECDQNGGNDFDAQRKRIL